MQNNDKSKTHLPANLRVVIGVASIPCLLLAGMLGVTIYQRGASDISAFEVLYAIAGVVAMYIAVTGKRLF